MRRAATAALVLALAGCSLEPRYTRPAPLAPPAWPTGPAYAEQVAGLPAVSWREVFRDPNLTQVIELALANNQDLAAALANVEVARGQYRITRAEQLPAISGSGGVNVSKVGAGRFGATGGGDILTIYSVNLGLAAFELDLFGRLRSQTRAAIADYLSTDAGVRTARLTLVAETASAYLALAADRTLLQIARDTERSAGETVRLTRARLEGGVAPRSDLALAQTIEAQARSDIARLTAQIAQDRNALELLAGSPLPDALLPAEIGAAAGQVGAVPAGLSSEVLLRRPDVLAAEYRLRGANARIGAARAAFLPRISLTAAAGLASTSLGGLFSGDAFNWSVGPGATVPIFQGGALSGNVAAARGTRELALAEYQRAIQTAFREVADALARRGTIGAQLAADRQLEAAARDTLFLADARYRGGVDTFLLTLDAQRTLYGARRTVAATQLDQATNLVEVYRALGGDELSDPVRLSGRATAGR